MERDDDSSLNKAEQRIHIQVNRNFSQANISLFLLISLSFASLFLCFFFPSSCFCSCISSSQLLFVASFDSSETFARREWGSFRDTALYSIRCLAEPPPLLYFSSLHLSTPFFVPVFHFLRSQPDVESLILVCSKTILSAAEMEERKNNQTGRIWLENKWFK